MVVIILEVCCIGVLLGASDSRRFLLKIRRWVGKIESLCCLLDCLSDCFGLCRANKRILLFSAVREMST